METIVKDISNTRNVKLKYQAPVVVVHATESKTQFNPGYGSDGGPGTIVTLS